MKQAATLFFLLVMTLLFLAPGCRGRKPLSDTSAAPATQTIAPADAKPSSNGTDAVTQTVDVEDGRSEDDGGVLTNPQTSKKAPKPPSKPAKKK